MKPTISLRKALKDPNLLGKVLAGPSWQPWRILLTSIMGEALTVDERLLFTQLTGRAHEPLQRVEEFVGVIGRRGGKSRAIATLATYMAGLCNHADTLVPGERGVLLVIAPDQRQATIILEYANAAFEASPILRQLIANKTSDTLELTNRITIEVRAASFRRLRGPTYICVVGDESAFWLNENSANPDDEILNAVRPGLASTAGMLVLISSPYARRGELWRLYNRHYGPNGDPLVLVAQGATRIFNPSLKQSVIDRAYERDPASAAAEFGALFRSDIEAFISMEAVNACVSTGIYERGPVRNVSYHGFCDPSGGSADSMALCVGHYDYSKQTVIIDALREAKPPFSPEIVVTEFATLLKTYQISRIIGDKYAGIWPAAEFSKVGVNYEASAAPKSELYQNLLPLINSRRIDLLDHPRCAGQLIGLERRTARSGKDSIDHQPGGHDDVCNAVAGVAVIATQYGGYDTQYRGFNEDDDDKDGRAAWQALRFSQFLRANGMP
jgi:hypothetical protein